MWRSKVALVSAAFLIVASVYPVRADLIPVLGGQRVGISGFQFLKIGVGARALGFGGAFTAIADDASALYWNPAGIVMVGRAAVASYTDWPVDLSHRFVGVAIPFGANAVGISLSQLACPETPVTTELQPEGTGEYWRYGDLAIAVTLARSMTDRFSFGLTARYVEESLDLLHMRAVTFDMGTYYRTGWGNTRFAVVVSNFGGDASPSGRYDLATGEALTSFESFSPPTEFRLGFADEIVDTPRHRLTASAQLNHPNDNAENLGVGLEYAMNEMVFVRAGLRLNSDAESSVLGAGVFLPVAGQLRADYAYTFMGDLGSASRLSMEVRF
ncbi:PorV/PorQ family protein [Candidatus Fermentibacteria bacterium]|nr:PorV/PorQ family protein [Candidatus Fermentibacteria bacterium]